MSEQIHNLIKKEQSIAKKEIDVFTNQAINKINQALEKFRYNVIVAVFHEVYSFFKKLSEENKNYENLKENFRKILIVINPVIPHLTNESLSKFPGNENMNWPEIKKEYLNLDEKIIVIQINGKKRNTIKITKEINENDLIAKIKEQQLVDKYIKDVEILKTIYVKNKLINIIVK